MTQQEADPVVADESATGSEQAQPQAKAAREAMQTKVEDAAAKTTTPATTEVKAEEGPQRRKRRTSMKRIKYVEEDDISDSEDVLAAEKKKRARQLDYQLRVDVGYPQLDHIVGRRINERTGMTEYLCKFLGRSYLHLYWLTFPEVELFIPEGYQKNHRVHLYDRKLRREGYQALDEVDDVEANKMTVEKILSHKVDPADQLDAQIEKRRRQLPFVPKFPRVTDYFLLENSEMLSERLLGIVKKLMKETGGDIFQSPVDVEEVPDYLNIITNPIDLGTIATRVGRESYYVGPPAVSLFASDVRLVFFNCKAYNAAGSDIWHIADELLRCFEKWLYDWLLCPSAWLKLPPSKDAEKDRKLLREFRDEAEDKYDTWAPWHVGCALCGSNENSAELLLCDRCDSEIHMHCSTPEITELPEGEWFCSYCQMRNAFEEKATKLNEPEAMGDEPLPDKEATKQAEPPSTTTAKPALANGNAATTTTSSEEASMTTTATAASSIPNIVMEYVGGDGKFNKRTTSKVSPKANGGSADVASSLSKVDAKDRAATFFLVKWMGLSVRFSTWERPEDIGDDEQIQRYFKFSRVPSAKEIRETTCQLPCCAKRHQYALATTTIGKKCCANDRFCTLGNGHEGECSRNIRTMGRAYGSDAYRQLHMAEQVKAQLFAFHCLLNNHTPDKDVLKQCGVYTNAYVCAKQYLAPKTTQEDEDEDYSEDEFADSSDDDAEFDSTFDSYDRRPTPIYPGILSPDNDEDEDGETGAHKKKPELEVGEVLSSIVEHITLGYPTELEPINTEVRYNSTYPVTTLCALPTFTEYAVVLHRSPFGLGMRLGVTNNENASVLGFQSLPGGMIGPAEASQAISVGDVLVAVNKRPVAGLSFKDLIAVINSSGENILFHFHSHRPAFMYPAYCQTKVVTQIRDPIPDDAISTESEYASYSYKKYKPMLKVGRADSGTLAAMSTRMLTNSSNYIAPNGPMQHLYAGVVDNSIDPHEHFASFLPARSASGSGKSGEANTDTSSDSHEFVPYEQSPTYKGGRTLRAYQVEGLNWMVSCIKAQRSCILADEMGLGKTVQVVSLIEHMKTEESIRGPYLIVVPLSTIQHWRREIESWTDLNVCVYHDIGDRTSKFTAKDMRSVIRDQEWYYPGLGNSICKFHILLTTFETILADFEEFEHIHWRLVVVDEAHRLKSSGSRVLKQMRVLHVDRKLLLTGTPLQNNTQELWVLLNYLEPVKFDNLEKFNARFGTLHSQEQVVELQQLLAPYILRRVKEDVEKSIPPKEETIIAVELTTLQKQYYRAIYDKNKSFLYRGTKNGLPTLNNIQLQLRKCCNHPFLIKGVEDRELEQLGEQPAPAQVMEKTIQSSGKMVLVSKLLPKLKREGHKVLIFSQFLKQLDLLERYCEANGFGYERLDGSTGGSMRQNAIDRFSRPHSKSFVFLLSTKAGGVGINLIAADTVIIFDSDWNPQNDLQAQSRCHRIGQKKSVQIYRLVTRNTYESEMFDRASQKLGLEHAVLGTTSFSETSQMEKPSAEQLVELLKRGAYALMDEDDTASKQFADRDIETILKENARLVVVGGNKTDGDKSNEDSGALTSPTKQMRKSPTKTRKRKSLGGMAVDRSSFVAEGSTGELSVDDPNFWEKVLPGAVSVEMLSLKLEDGSAVSSRQAKIKFINNLDIALSSLADEMRAGNSVDDGGVGSRNLTHEYDIAIQVLSAVLSKHRNDFSHEQLDVAKNYLTKLEKSRVRSCRLAPARKDLFEDEDFDTPKRKRRRKSNSAAPSEDEAFEGTPKKKSKRRGRPPKHPKLAVATATDKTTKIAEPASVAFQGGVINDSDDLCTLCGDGGLILLCDGPCHRSFHLECVGMHDEPDDDEWLCPDCTAGRHMCLICKQVGEMGGEFGVIQCSMAKCGRFYHKGCLAKHPRVEWVGKKRFRCPSHFCHVCSRAAEPSRAAKEDKSVVVSCIHCSQAFHPLCIPSTGKFMRLSKNLMICANHLDGKKPPATARQVLPASEKSKSRSTTPSPAQTPLRAKDAAAKNAGALLAAAAAQTRLEISEPTPVDDEDEDDTKRVAKTSANGKRKRTSKSTPPPVAKKSKPKPTPAAPPKQCALCHRGNVMGGGPDDAKTPSPQPGPTNKTKARSASTADSTGPAAADSTGPATADMALEGPFIEAPVRLKFADKPEERVFVHLNCAVHSPEVYVKADGLIMNLPRAIKRGRQLKCTRCHAFGATVGCVEAKCRRNYHLRCAVESGGEIDGTTYSLYCQTHAAMRQDPVRVCVSDCATTDETDATLSLACSSCSTRFHPKCLGFSDRQAKRKTQSKWVCSVCDGMSAKGPVRPQAVKIPEPAKAPAQAPKPTGTSSRRSSAKTSSPTPSSAASPRRKKPKKNRLSMARKTSKKSKAKSSAMPHAISPHMDSNSDSDLSTEETMEG